MRRVHHFSIEGIQNVYLLFQKWYTKGWGGGLSVKSNIRAFNKYIEIKQVTEEVHDSRGCSTVFRYAGLHLATLSAR